MNRGKILVVRGGAIGDFILTLPALAALRKQFPQTWIEVLGYPHIASLAKLAGCANEIRSIEARPLAGFFARQGDLDEGLCDYFASFNIIVSYLYDPDEIFRDNIAGCSKGQFITGPYRPTESGNLHATEVFLKPLEQLAIFDADPVPRLKIAFGNRANNSIAIHPGSGSERKNWPEEHWQELLKRVVSETNWRVLLVGGEAEEPRLQALSSLVPLERLNIALRQPLPELAARLAANDLFIGHDSGITHLAAAVGLRGVALWGETAPNIWRPRSDRFELLRDEEGLSHLTPDRVFDTLVRLITQRNEQ